MEDLKALVLVRGKTAVNISILVLLTFTNNNPRFFTKTNILFRWLFVNVKYYVK